MPILGKGVGGGGALNGGLQGGGGGFQEAEVGGGEIISGQGATNGNLGGQNSEETDGGGVTKSIAIRFRFEDTLINGLAVGRVISIPNHTRFEITTDAGTHTSTDWQFRRLPQEQLVYNFSTTAAGRPTPDLAVIRTFSLTDVELDLDRQYSWEMRFRENPVGEWSSWKAVDMSGKRRGISRGYRNKYVETVNPDGSVTIEHTNPRQTVINNPDGSVTIVDNNLSQ